jgi:hypothetical protein
MLLFELVLLLFALFFISGQQPGDAWAEDQLFPFFRLFRFPTFETP